MENNLNDLNIYALRELGRRVGVNSPTSKKKEELINDILSIQSGKKQPEKQKTKQGRPPKTFAYSLGLMDNLKNITLNQNSKEYDSLETETTAGYIELINNNSAFLWVEKFNTYVNYFISSQIVEKYNLKTGDRVVVKLIKDANQTTIADIYNINGCPQEKYNKNRVDYFSFEPIIPNKKLLFKKEEYNNLSIKNGENIYIYGSNNNVNTCTIIDMLNTCENEHKIYVNISVAEKNKVYLNNIKNAEKLTANITDDIDLTKRILTLAIERAKRVLETGNDVTIFVDDMQSISSVDSLFVKSLTSLAKQTKKAGSITLIAIMPNQNLTYIEKLADKRLNIVDNSISILN